MPVDFIISIPGICVKAFIVIHRLADMSCAARGGDRRIQAVLSIHAGRAKNDRQCGYHTNKDGCGKADSRCLFPESKQDDGWQASAVLLPVKVY